MLTPPSFDTLKIAQDLKGAGFTEQQAEALTDAIKAAFTDTVATKADIQTLETTLKADIQTLETTLKADIQTVDARMDAMESRLEAHMDATESRLEARMAERFESLYKHLWLGAVGIVATIAALVRLLSG